MKLSSYNYECQACFTKIPVSASYYRVLNSRNPNRICKLCQNSTKSAEYKHLMGITTEGRTCTTCNTWKNWTDFPGKDMKKVNKVGTCKQCVRNLFTTKWGSDPEFKKATQLRSKQSHLKNTYGITLEQYERLLDSNSRQCRICNSPEDLAVDHCHITNKIRGILCRNCNKALGIFKDSTELLSNAVRYLNEAS